MATKSTKKPVRKTKTSAKSTNARRSTTSKKVTKKAVSTKAAPKQATVSKVTDSMKQLRLWHIIIGLLHAVQAVVIVVLANDFSVPMTTSYLTNDSLNNQLAPASRQLFDVRVAWAVAAFFAVAAVAHLLIATVLRSRYEKAVSAGVNRMRWIEYVLGSGILLLTVALLLGIRDLGTLILLFVVNEGVHLMAYQLETGAKSYPHLPLKIAGKFAATIAIVLGWFVFATKHYGSANEGAYRYWLLGVGAALFALFAYVVYARYKNRGRFADFVYTEKAYAVLSLVAKSAVAWIIFAAVLK